MVRRAVEVMAGFPGVAAVVVSGSLASPVADRFSDLDLGCVVDDDDVDWWRSGWPGVVEAVAGPLVVANPIGGPVIGGFALTPRWEHVDLVVHPVSSFVAPPWVQVLHDPRGLVRLAAPPPAAEPYFPSQVVELFCYLLGASTVTLGRGEVILAHAGGVPLRDQLVTVMLAENGVHKVDGHKRLNPYLTQDQRTVLLALPVAVPEPASIVRAYHAIATEVVQRSRALADRTGSPFPDALLAATVAHLERELGGSWTGLGPI